MPKQHFKVTAFRAFAFDQIELGRIGAQNLAELCSHFLISSPINGPLDLAPDSCAGLETIAKMAVIQM
jgi:hypothetical protein